MQASSCTFLTKFERAAIIGFRAKQLEAGASTTLSPSEVPAGGDTHAVASAELALRRSPVRLRRPGVAELVDPNALHHLPFY